MYILAIDTSTKTASVALQKNTDLLMEIIVNLDLHHSEILLPIIDQVLKVTGICIRNIDYYTCTIGPGSFTGVRIGASTIKGLALAAEKPFIGISTLEALSMNLSGSPIMLCPMLDARKNQIYTALYRTNADGMLELKKAQCVTDVENFLKSIEHETFFIGEGAVKYKELIKEILPGLSFFASNAQNYIMASAVGILAFNKIKSGASLIMENFDIEYLRQSDAESVFSFSTNIT